MKKSTKYKNKKVEIDGIEFDSIVEGEYYAYLKDLKKKGKIKDFEVQPLYVIQDSFVKSGKKWSQIKYTADFRVVYHDLTEEVIDIKGFTTTAFALKRKMFEKKFPFPLKLVTKSLIDGGWIELDQLKKNRAVRRKQKENKKIEKEKDDKK